MSAIGFGVREGRVEFCEQDERKDETAPDDASGVNGDMISSVGVLARGPIVVRPFVNPAWERETILSSWTAFPNRF